MSTTEKMDSSVLLPDSVRSESHDSVTAMEYINSQLQLESEAREIMPFAFDHCTKPLDRIRQTIFSCKTCLANPAGCPPPLSSTAYGAAAICYSCSISCHGDHELVELFSKRNVVCDCGTTKIPGSKCELRKIVDDEPVKTNKYCHNYWGRFCACDENYDPESTEGTMYQCLLGDACNEDWFHDKCILGEEDARRQRKVKESRREGAEGENGTGEEEEEDDTLPGIPGDQYENFICWKCLEKNPWLRRYAGTEGFHLPLVKKDAVQELTKPENTDNAITQPNSEPDVEDEKSAESPSTKSPTADSALPKKRKADDLVIRKPIKKLKTPEPPSVSSSQPKTPSNPCTYNLLPPPPNPSLTFSLFATANFRSSLCRCPTCFPHLSKYPVLLEPETTYEPPLDSDSEHDETGSVHSGGSLFERGERALGMVDRVKAIEGVMAYNDLKEKVKAFLKPFAENGKPVGADDVKRYFAELRGDVDASGGEKGLGK